jgi:hypothetical protein
MSNELVQQNFNDDDTTDNRAIQGQFLKFTTAATWETADGVAIEPGRRLIALGSATVLQYWHGGALIDTIPKKPGKPFPNVDELNAKIPTSEWEAGLSGEPRPPWQLQRMVYLLDPQTAERFTFSSGAIGAKIAVSNLRDRTNTMQSLRGANVRPLIALGAKPMKTRFGVRQRDLRVDRILRRRRAATCGTEGT